MNFYWKTLVQIFKDSNSLVLNTPINKIIINVIDMASGFLKQFEKMNTTTKSIYDLEDFKVLIILKDGTNLTSWEDVEWKEDNYGRCDDTILYISEDLSDFRDLSERYKKLEYLKAFVACGVSDKLRDLSGMFENCESLVDISGLDTWDVSNVENMSCMFKECYKLENINSLASWDVSNVKYMTDMFYRCYRLTDLSPLKDWNVSNLKSMEGMFYLCSHLSDLSPLSGWDVASVETMEGLFYSCPLEDLSPLKDWDVSNAKNMCMMFCDCPDLHDLTPLTDWDLSNAEDIGHMFWGLPFLTDLSPLKDWDVSNVKKWIASSTAAPA